jgi:hypothetical protein
LQKKPCTVGQLIKLLEKFDKELVVTFHDNDGLWQTYNHAFLSDSDEFDQEYWWQEDPNHADGGYYSVPKFVCLKGYDIDIWTLLK